MTEIDKDWCINMAKKEGNHDIAAGHLAMDPMPLSERVEAHAAGDDWELRVEIADALGWTHKQVGGVVAWYSPDQPDTMKAGPPKWLTSLDAAMTLTKADALGTSDVNAFAALSDAILALEDAGWPKGEWAKVLPRYVAAASLRAIEGMK